MDQPDLDKLVVIRSGLDGHQANMLKLNLEGQGVPAFLANENTGSLNFLSHTDLFVRAKDWAAAEQALSKIETFPRAQGAPGAPGNVGAGDGGTRDVGDIGCSHCGSSRVMPFVGDVPTAIPFVVTKAGPTDGWYHCNECDSYYTASRSRFSSMPIALGWSAFMGALAFGLILLINWLMYL